MTGRNFSVGTGLNYQRSGKGTVLVLVHGFLLGLGFWRPVVELFEDRFDIIAIDLPGFAGSAKEPIAENISELAQSVVDLLDELNVDKFSLIGHSMRGSIVQEIALENSDRVEKLCVYASSSGIESFPPVNPDSARSPDERQDVLEKEGVDGLRKWMAPFWFADGEQNPYLEECMESGNGCSEEVAKMGGKYMTSWDRTADLDQIKAPTLVIGGDKDRTFSVEALTFISRSVLDGQLCIIPGVAHCAHYENKTVFNHVLGEFFKT
ncbi:alpha/beta hydrolase [Gammaproteobacteria bacterium]|nr:alpha/beta hydrolase [Gammaproteobacteria bacterium]